MTARLGAVPLRESFVALGLALLGIWQSVAAAPLELYVSPQGNDAWTGRTAEPKEPDGPFATLSRARDEVRKLKAAGQLAEGATVNILPGLYPLAETFKLGAEDSGTEQAPVVYRGVGDSKPILSGGRPLTGWQPYKNDILACDLEANGLAGRAIWMLVLDGEAQVLARYPNHDPNDVHHGQWAHVAAVDGAQNKTEFRYGEDETHAWANPQQGRVHIHPYFDWGWNIVPIKAYSTETRTITLGSPVSYDLHLGDRYFIDNLFEELDAPGEWYRDPQTETLYFRPPKPIATAVVTAAILDDIVLIEGAEWVTLQGMVLETCNGTPVRIKDSRHGVAAANVVRNCGGWGITVEGGNRSGARGNDIYWCGRGGVNVNGGNRDTLEPGNNFADNNYIHHCGRAWKTYNPGVSVSGVGNSASHNLVHDMPHAAVTLSGNDNVIEFNVFRHCNLESTDTGGLYFCSRDWTQRGNIIRHNIFHHCGGFGKANSWDPLAAGGGRVKFEYPHFTWGIYLDDPTTGTQVYGNIVYAAPICGLHNHGGRDNTWENNIVIDAPGLNAGMLAADWNEWPAIKDRLHQRQKPGSTYLQKYPELAAYTDEEPEAMTGVRVVRNIFYYTKAGTAWLRGREGKGWGGENCQLLYSMHMRRSHFEKNEWAGNCVFTEGDLEPRIRLSLAPDPTKNLTWDEWQALGADRDSIRADPLFVDPANHDYRLRPDSPVLKLGFKPIPVEQIGPYQDASRASWPIVEAPGAAALGDFTTERYYQPPQFRPLPATGTLTERNGAGNAFAKLAAGKPLKVAYFGGGIHYANGWRQGVMDWFRARNGNVTELDASVCDCVRGSGWSVFRFEHDVLQHKPDLVFVDFTSDDFATDPTAIQRTIEGVVRQARRSDPELDVIILHAFRQGFETDYAQNLLPAAVSAYERVAQHYGIPSIDMAYRVAELARDGKLLIQAKPDEAKQAGKLLFSEGGVRPTGDADRVYAEVITAALDKLAARPAAARRDLPAPCQPDNLENARQVPITRDMLSGDWRELAVDDELRQRFKAKMDTTWYTCQPGAKLTFRFKGTDASVYDLMGPDTGRAKITIDGNDGGVRQQVDPWSYYQRQAGLAVAGGIEDKEHTVIVELLPDPPDRRVPVEEAKKAGRYDPNLFQGVAFRFGAIRVVGEVLGAPDPDAGRNLALPENGGKVTASSELGGYPVDRCTDGLRCRDSGYWNDGTQNQFPDWVQVAWPQPQRIGVVRAALPFMPAHPEPQRKIGSVTVEYWDAAANAWARLVATNGTPNPLPDWVAPRNPGEDNVKTWQAAAVTTDRVRLLFERGQSDGWALLDELEVYDATGPLDPVLTAAIVRERKALPADRTIWRLGSMDGKGGGLCAAPRTLKDDGTYQDGGYWATPLAWFMVTLMRRDPTRAATIFCDAVADFQAHKDINEWVNEDAAKPVGIKDYCASAAMPLEGVRRLRTHLAQTGKTLPPGLAARLDAGATWLEGEARRVLRGSSRLGKGDVRIFTPDATGGYGAFWVRDWSYSIEGCPAAFSRDEVRDGYLFLAAAQRGDGCMPDRVRADGVGVYSPGGEQNPFSKNGSVDQSPFMVIVCHQHSRLFNDLEPFRKTADALEKAMRFTPRNRQTAQVAIWDPSMFRPYSFMDCIPLVGDEQFSSVLFWDASRKLAELFEAAGQPDRATTWRQEAEKVQTGMSTLWDTTLGMFVAASEKWRQPSVWGSVFAVYAGIATPEQSDRIARYCLDNYDLIVKRGQVRHLPKGTYWGKPEPEYVTAWKALAGRTPDGIVFTVNQDNAAQAFPAAQPGDGMRDAFPLRVRFTLARTPAKARLVVGLCWDEAYRKTPVGLSVTVNGQAGEAAIPNAGRDDLGLDKEWPAAVSFALPPGVLRTGENEIVLRVRGETGWHYDGLALLAER